MKNHFGEGVMDGVRAYEPKSANEMSQHCFDYRRGFVCGFAHSFGKRVDNRYMAACRAGELARDYGLERDAIADFFHGSEDRGLQEYYYSGYERSRRAAEVFFGAEATG